MYINKCTKCGAEFETKNPKRVICPNCLYPERKSAAIPASPDAGIQSDEQRQRPTYNYSSPDNRGERRPYNRNDRQDYQPRRYDRPQYNQGDRPQGGYDRPRNNYERPQYNQGDRPQGNYNRPERNDYHGDRPFRPSGPRPPMGRPAPGGFNRRGPRPQSRPKQLLVSKEQIGQIEILYKKTLPLPNPDIHEVIGSAIELEPRKVFFGINLVRQKMMLPKLPFPKRKLAVSPDQLFAIKSLYEPLLPLPPIGCHKIIAAQLKMDEWRVHVGIGLVRKQMGLDRWNPDRPDAPAEFKSK